MKKKITKVEAKNNNNNNKRGNKMQQMGTINPKVDL